MSKVPGMEVEATPKQPEALKKLPALVNTVVSLAMLLPLLLHGILVLLWPER